MTAPMAASTPAPKPDSATNTELPDTSHEWVVAAMVRVPANVAKHADFRGSFRVKADQRIEALETYCEKCRRPYEDVADEKCSAKINNEHLIGGNQDERVKRKQVNLPPGARVIPGPKINRRGIGAYIRGEV